MSRFHRTGLRLAVRGCAALGLAAAVAVTCAAAAAAPNTSKRASKLAKRDPGARIGANTHVATAAGARVLGTTRTDFIIGLGPRQTIVGGGGADQLGSLGRGTTIRGGKGGDHLYGGPGATLIGGGGSDLLSSTSRRVRFRVSSGDWVIATGRKARIRCSAKVRNAVINARRDARIDPACSRNGNTIRRPGQGSLRASAPVAQAAQVSGDGSNDHPFVAPCDNASVDPCTVSSFAARGLTGLWAHEYIPAYACPPSHPWLINNKYAPAFTAIPNGVDIQEQLPWAIGISMSGQSWYPPLSDPPPNRFNGTLTGFPSSSATSWSFGTHYYRVVLHCTANCDLGYDLTGSHPCTSPSSLGALSKAARGAAPSRV